MDEELGKVSVLSSRRNVWINNSRVGRVLAEILGNQAERLSFAISRLVSVVVPLDLVAYEPQTIPIPATAGNVETYIRPFRGHRLQILYGRIELTTDGTVATRNILFCIRTEGGDYLYWAFKGADRAASGSTSMSISPVGIGIGAQGNDNASLTLNTPLELFGVDRFGIQVANGVAGDSYSGFFKVRWL